MIWLRGSVPNLSSSVSQPSETPPRVEYGDHIVVTGSSVRTGPFWETGDYVLGNVCDVEGKVSERAAGRWESTDLRWDLSFWDEIM